MNVVVCRYLVLCVLLGVMTACAKQERVSIPTLPLDPTPPHDHEMEGMASWYGRPHHGRRAASGEIYNMHRLTAAHRTLPFHTTVRVHNKSNGREITVRINDRGPYEKERIIDLSYAAAKALDMLKAGVAAVRLTIVPTRAHYGGDTPHDSGADSR